MTWRISNMTKHTTLKPTKPDSQLQSDQQKITWLNSIIITFSVVIIGVAPLDVPLRDQYLLYTLNTELDNLMVSIEIAGVDSIEEDLHPPPKMQMTCSN
jgi:hypothetical protein